MSTPAATRQAGATRRLVDTVAALAGDRFTGRRVGTSGGRAAGQWLAAQLRAAGAATRVEAFPVAGVRELTDTPTLIYQGRALAHRRDWAEHGASAGLPDGAAGAVVTAQAGHWRGRWILLPVLDAASVARAAAEKAIGILVPRGVDEAGWMPKMITGPTPLPLPVVSLHTVLHATLAAAGDDPAPMTGRIPVRVVATTGTNVHGVLREAPPGGRSILLTAHYDGVGDDPQQRLPAAADNASGVAVVLEAARHLAGSLPAGVGLAVALLDAEEAGALGSAHHATQLTRAGGLTSGTVVLNVDGAAHLDGAATIEAGGAADELLDALDTAGRTVGMALRAGPMASDNRRYAAAGLPAAGVGMGMPGYQTPAETPDRVEPDTLLAATRLVTATVRILADRTRR
ncbi:M28 family peptidase [Actinocatenispora sera]|uniref:M28 family metallopeptidase n=1 Tax=Actinocatenispora sera TaxID=390989 RepID=UPI0033E19D6D